ITQRFILFTYTTLFRSATVFYYQNVIDCVRYQIRQVAYRLDIVHVPIREYDSVGIDCILRCIQQTGGGKLRYEIRLEKTHCSQRSEEHTSELQSPCNLV